MRSGFDRISRYSISAAAKTKNERIIIMKNHNAIQDLDAVLTALRYASTVIEKACASLEAQKTVPPSYYVEPTPYIPEEFNYLPHVCGKCPGYECDNCSNREYSPYLQSYEKLRQENGKTE